MQHPMSYRKPAPIYVPSPPSSPPISVAPLSPCATMESEIPPLPNDWREAISQASAGAWKNSTVVPRSHSCIDFSSTETSAFPPRTLTPRSPTSNRKPHHNYRPPTPPLQARSKRRRAEIGFSDPLSSQILAHETDLGVVTNLGTSIDGSSVSTLAADHSSKNKSQSSNACTDVGLSTWIETMSTCSSQPAGDAADLNSWLSFPRYNAGASQRHSASYACGADTTSEVSFWKRLGTWGRVFRTRLHNVSVCTFIC